MGKPSTRYTVTLIAVLFVLVFGGAAILVAALAGPETGLTALNLYMFLVSGLVALAVFPMFLLPEPVAWLVVSLGLLFNVRQWLSRRSRQPGLLLQSIFVRPHSLNLSRAPDKIRRFLLTGDFCARRAGPPYARPTRNPMIRVQIWPEKGKES